MVLPETGYFTVDVFEKENILFIDVFDYKSGKLVALVRAFYSYSRHSLILHPIYKFDGKQCYSFDSFMVYTDNGYGLFAGTPTMNVQIRGGRFSFEGNGLWGRDNLNK